MSDAPGGLSDAEFKSWYVEAGEWVWGTAQGAFNEKATFNQIIVDAVIGMIPLVNDITAARDLIAISMHLINEPKKREDPLEWVALVIMLLALIPVLGGVIKGVGRLTVKGVRTARAMKDAAGILGELGKTAEEIIQFMNRLGIGDAEKWFLNLRVMDHLPTVENLFRTIMNGIVIAIETFLRRIGWILPKVVVNKMKGLVNGFKFLQKQTEKMIPDALKQFNQMLMDMQEFIRSGGSRLAVRAEEAAVKVAAKAAEDLAKAEKELAEAAALRQSVKEPTKEAKTAARAKTSAKAPDAAEAQAKAASWQEKSQAAAMRERAAEQNLAQKQDIAKAAQAEADSMTETVKAAKAAKPPKPAQVNGTVVAGHQNTALVSEARMRELADKRFPRRVAGEHPAYEATGSKQRIAHIYTSPPANRPEIPDLLSRTEYDAENILHYVYVEAFSRKAPIVTRAWRYQEKGFRLYGPEGITHGLKVGETFPRGNWVVIGQPPASTKAMREGMGLLDDFNRTGYVVEMTMVIPNPKHPPYGAYGTIAEQYSKKIPGHYLPGGRPQGFIGFQKRVGLKPDGSPIFENTSAGNMLERLGDEAKMWESSAIAKGEKIKNGDILASGFDPDSGIEFVVKKLEWPDANGVYGYRLSDVGDHAATATLATSGRITHRAADKLSEEETIPQTTEEVYTP